MTVQTLVLEKKAFAQQYSTRDLFDLVFTDYKNYPSELLKVQDLELYAKERVGQIVNAYGIQPKESVKELFAIINEIKEEAKAAGNAFITPEVLAAAAASYVDYGGGGDGGGGGG
jgi:hypothetical protein